MFFGRIGLFRNQPGDRLLGRADVVVSVGYDPVEYGLAAWNAGGRARVVHVDDIPCDVDNHYQPEVELRGSVEATLDANLGGRTFAPSADLQGL